MEPDPDPAAQRSVVGPLLAFCKEDQFSLELLFQALVSSSDRLSPLSPTPRPGSGAPAPCPPGQRTPEEGGTAVSHGDPTGVRPAADWVLGQEQSAERVLQDPMEPGPGGPERVAR